MRIVSVVGTRPQLIKAAALGPTLRARHHDVFVDTGQHWDEQMAGTFFAELGLPRPDHDLGIGGGGHAGQTGRMLIALEPILLAERPDAVLVYGDTNSTLAGALAAAKLGIPVAHVEAGLRSFDRRHAGGGQPGRGGPPGDLVLRPDALGGREPRRRGDHAGRRGGRRPDAGPRGARGRRGAGPRRAGRGRGRPGRPAHARRLPVRDDPSRGEPHAATPSPRGPASSRSAARPGRPVILALHPGTRAALDEAGIVLPPGIRVVEPLGYRTTLTLELHAAAVLTDSGGVQREAAWLGTPCLVLRSTTEWVEAVSGSAGRMVVVGLDRVRALAALDRLAPSGRSAADARTRAASLDLAPAGAADAIVAALDAAGSGR